MKKLLLIVGLLIVLGSSVAWYLGRNTAEAAPLRTAAVRRDDLVTTISATGTVEPEELIDIGAQVAGKILEFGKDTRGKPIDYGSEVKQGIMLARIDDSVYKAELAQATAGLAEANAGVTRAQADLAQLKAKHSQAERDWQRAQTLASSEALAQVSFDAYKATYESAVANVAVGEASILQAKASVDQAKSNVERAERNLGYTTIFSPVDGQIIDRRVNIGQTVVASLNAPSLFLIAKDLRRMQVWVAVNEADVGQIHAGQPVTFTVDAFPGESFKGEVNKVRLNAQMTQNVVTYTVEVTTDNSSGKLLPYLTANVQFEVSRADDVLLVPNSALRWTPRSEEMIAPDAREAEKASGEDGAAQPASAPSGAPSGGGTAGSAGAPGGGDRPRGRRGRAAAGADGDAGERPRAGKVWVKEGQFVRPVDVRAGLTDGTNTQIQSDSLKEGAEVVVGEILTMTASGSQTTNPFGPPAMRGRGGSGGGGGGRGGAGGGGPRGGPRGG